MVGFLAEERLLYWAWGVALGLKHAPLVLNLIVSFILNLGCFKWLVLVNRRGFGPQGVKQVVIFKFAFVWIKGRITFIIIKGNTWLNPHWLSMFSCFRPLRGSIEWGLAVEVGQWEPIIFKGKKMVQAKTLGHS